jgi:uncharacterized damage-inducible protein DinB
VNYGPKITDNGHSEANERKIGNLHIIEPFCMKKPANPEYWLRGPVPGIPPLLQPVAHALLQSREEVNALMEGFPEERLWDRLAGMASPGFHLQHMAGVLDRLFTYADGDALSPRQLEYLAAEGNPPGNHALAGLIETFNAQIDNALQQLSRVPEDILTAPRAVGRAKIPSTVGGLLFHAAEHTMRHTGQLLVTAGILRAPP